MSKKLYFLGVCMGILCGLTVFHSPAKAATQAGIFTSAGKLQTTLPAIAPGSSLFVADLKKIGTQDIIVGSPKGKAAGVSVYTQQGKVLYQLRFPGVRAGAAVHVAAGDVNSDGLQELVVSFGPGTAPEVWVLTPQGKRLQTFYAFDKKFRGGVNISVSDVTGDGVADIVAAPEQGGGPNVQVYSGQGKRLSQFNAYPSSVRSGLAIVAADLTGDGVAEILTTTPAAKSMVKVFTFTGFIIQSFTASVSAVRSVNIASVPTREIVLGTAAGVPGLVTSYTYQGSRGAIQFYPYGKNFSQGVTVAALTNAQGDPQIVVAPGATEEKVGNGTGKKIVVDISEQRLYQYENGILIGTHIVSTGKWSMPTPLGTFSIHGKISTAYSRAYHLYMDNWMAITPDGKYGIHSLPYWRLKNGSIYYEGVAHLGIRVSHGCIRLSPKESAAMYKWAPVGTQVIVRA